MKARDKFQELNLSNAFLFAAVMNDAEVCRQGLPGGRVRSGNGEWRRKSAKAQPVLPVPDGRSRSEAGG